MNTRGASSSSSGSKHKFASGNFNALTKAPKAVGRAATNDKRYAGSNRFQVLKSRAVGKGGAASATASSDATSAVKLPGEPGWGQPAPAPASAALDTAWGAGNASGGVAVAAPGARGANDGATWGDAVARARPADFLNLAGGRAGGPGGDYPPRDVYGTPPLPPSHRGRGGYPYAAPYPPGAGPVPPPAASSQLGAPPPPRFPSPATSRSRSPHGGQQQAPPPQGHDRFPVGGGSWRAFDDAHARPTRGFSFNRGGPAPPQQPRRFGSRSRSRERSRSPPGGRGGYYRRDSPGNGGGRRRSRSRSPSPSCGAPRGGGPAARGRSRTPPLRRGGPRTASPIVTGANNNGGSNTAAKAAAKAPLSAVDIEKLTPEERERVRKQQHDDMIQAVERERQLREREAAELREKEALANRVLAKCAPEQRAALAADPEAMMALVERERRRLHEPDSYRAPPPRTSAPTDDVRGEVRRRPSYDRGYNGGRGYDARGSYRGRSPANRRRTPSRSRSRSRSRSPTPRSRGRRSYSPRSRSPGPLRRRVSRSRSRSPGGRSVSPRRRQSWRDRGRRSYSPRSRSPRSRSPRSRHGRSFSPRGSRSPARVSVRSRGSRGRSPPRSRGPRSRSPRSRSRSPPQSPRGARSRVGSRASRGSRSVRSRSPLSPGARRREPWARDRDVAAPPPRAVPGVPPRGDSHDGVMAPPPPLPPREPVKKKLYDPASDRLVEVGGKDGSKGGKGRGKRKGAARGGVRVLQGEGGKDGVPAQGPGDEPFAKYDGSVATGPRDAQHAEQMRQARAAARKARGPRTKGVLYERLANGEVVVAHSPFMTPEQVAAQREAALQRQSRRGKAPRGDGEAQAQAQAGSREASSHEAVPGDSSAAPASTEATQGRQRGWETAAQAQEPRSEPAARAYTSDGPGDGPEQAQASEPRAGRGGGGGGDAGASASNGGDSRRVGLPPPSAPVDSMLHGGLSVPLSSVVPGDYDDDYDDEDAFMFMGDMEIPIDTESLGSAGAPGDAHPNGNHVVGASHASDTRPWGSADDSTAPASTSTNGAPSNSTTSASRQVAMSPIVGSDGAPSATSGSSLAPSFATDAATSGASTAASHLATTALADMTLAWEPALGTLPAQPPHVSVELGGAGDTTWQPRAGASGTWSGPAQSGGGGFGQSGAAGASFSAFRSGSTWASGLYAMPVDSGWGAHPAAASSAQMLPVVPSVPVSMPVPMPVPDAALTADAATSGPTTASWLSIPSVVSSGYGTMNPAAPAFVLPDARGVLASAPATTATTATTASVAASAPLSQGASDSPAAPPTTAAVSAGRPAAGGRGTPSRASSAASKAGKGRGRGSRGGNGGKSRGGGGGGGRPRGRRGAAAAAGGGTPAQSKGGQQQPKQPSQQQQAQQQQAQQQQGGGGRRKDKGGRGRSGRGRSGRSSRGGGHASSSGGATSGAQAAAQATGASGGPAQAQGGGKRGGRSGKPRSGGGRGRGRGGASGAASNGGRKPGGSAGRGKRRKGGGAPNTNAASK